jgi:hypothetical protein
MADRTDYWITGEKQLCSAETLLYYLGLEIERHRRYGHPFAMVLIQPPAGDDESGRLESAHLVADHALAMVRTCDLVAVFNRGAFAVALLPETDAAGARRVFERFDARMVQPGLGGTLKFAFYPEHNTSIDYFLDRFTGFLSGRDLQATEAVVVSGEDQESAAVSQSWEDIVASTEGTPTNSTMSDER